MHRHRDGTSCGAIVRRAAAALVLAAITAAAAPGVARPDDPPGGGGGDKPPGGDGDGGAAPGGGDAGGGKPGDPPPGGGANPGDAPPDDDPVAAEKRKRIELDRRRDELPETAKPAGRILDRFREKDFRVWGTLRNEVVAQGANGLPALLLGLEETDWETRAFAASCLGQLGDKSAVGALADAYLKEKYSEARRQTVLALGDLRAASAAAPLVRALDDEELGVRLAALNGLAPIATPAQADAFRRFLADPDLDVRYAALAGLAAINDEKAVALLVSQVEALVDDKRTANTDSTAVADNGDRYTQYLLGIALSWADDKRAQKLLVDALTAAKPYDHKDFLRMGAAVGIGMRGARTGKFHPALATGITDRDERVRIACSYGAGFVQSKDLVPRLTKALSDSQKDVRYNAVTALGRIGDDEAAQALRRALGDRSDEVRVGTVRALGLVRNETATKALVTAARDDKYMIRVLAARQLAYRTQEPDVLDALSRAADDPDFGVRESALAALAHHPDGAAVHAKLAAGVDDADFGVQANACLALAKVGPATPAIVADDGLARKVVLAFLRATQKKLVRAGDEFLDAVRPPGAVLPLIDGLGSDVEETRRRANVALLRISEKSGMGFDPAGPKGERDAGIRRWREWWDGAKQLPPRGSRMRAAVTGALADAAKDLKWKGLDIALLFDSTGSMGGLIDAAKERIDELAAELNELLPSVRVSVYTYRDKGDTYLFYGTPLTFDTWKIQGFLQYANAGQGGDLPEAVYETVKNCAEHLQWRPTAHKVIVYAGDATHHREDDDKFMSFIAEWFTKPRQAALHALFTDTKRRSLDIKARKRREIADGARYPVFEVYQRTATAGRGKAVMLGDESALMKELLVLTFGDEWRADIENLMDFER